MAVAQRPFLISSVFILVFGINCNAAAGAQYLGKFLGKLSELHHGVSGEVYAVDARTLHIKDFTYDGQGPAAYFFAGSSRAPGNTGFRIRDENGSPDVLRRYRKEGVTITLPEGKSLNNIRWFSVWCEEFEVNFGDVKIPKNFDYPRPQKIDGLRGVHGVSSENIVIVDAQTLLVPSLSYDGEAPDAKFWVGRGAKPSPQGIRVPDENGKEIPLRRYDRKTVVLTLPGDLTVFDIGHFGIWCEAFTVDFGHVQIPQNLNVPPSLKMLGVSPQSKLNCEVLHDDLAFEVRWAVAGDSIVLQLVAKLENREYMSFGISGNEDKSAMIGGDVVVAWVDKETLKGYAEDYYLEAKSQCSGPRGSCPDSKLADNTNNIRLLNAAMVNGYSIVTYQRPLRPTDIYDKQIYTNQTQPVIWALGPLNQRDEVSFHSQYNKKDKFIDFGRPAKWNCPMPEGDQPTMKIIQKSPPVAAATLTSPEISTTVSTVSRTRGRNPDRRGSSSSNRQAQDNDRSQSQSQSQTSNARQRNGERRGSSRGTTSSSRPIPSPAPVKNRNAWDIPPIQCNEPDDGVFYAQMGPTGGKRGYPAITGHVGWGISWYINGLLIPEINVVRGKTYTFVVEGGFDPEIPAKYHPFYITDDSIGGYEYKTPEERKNVRIFAGARQTSDGAVHPTGVGRLCHWTHQGDSEADDFDSFGAYQRTLELKCDQGEPGVIQWTPDKDTPDTVYYQCFTHRYLGWKINVLDYCDIGGAASEIQETIVPAENLEDLADSPSIRVETRIKPNNIEEVLNKNEQIIVLEENDKEQEKENDKDFSKTEEKIFLQELPNLEKKIMFRSESEIPKKNLTLLPMPLPQVHQKMPILKIPMTKVVVRRPPMRPPTKTHTFPMGKIRRPTVIIKKPHYHQRRPMVIPIPMGQTHRPMLLPQPQNIFIMKPQTKQILPANLAQGQKQILSFPANLPKSQQQIFPVSANLAQTQKQILPLPTNLAQSPIWIPEPLKLTSEPHVEISKLQASTERQSEALPLTDDPIALKASPSNTNYKLTLKQAINTGFDPSSVVIESGFKPIITKEIESRMSELQSESVEPEIAIESEVGVIDETGSTDSILKEPTAQSTEYFEPMFIPSPTIDMKKTLKKKLFAYKQNLQRQQPPERRSLNYYRDHEMAANERVNAYYLPPETKRKIEPRPRYDMPPDTVVTFDGKKVSGASLTPRAGYQNQKVHVAFRSSKASHELIRRPQSVPFKGELPPLNGKIDLNAPQFQGRVLHRELDAPKEDNRKYGRSKRDAHHTEEHTAQQEKERMEMEKAAMSQANFVQITFSALVAGVIIQLVV